ncbi:MAG: glycosyltransferase family 2 protein [Candidatus Kerfeldbacteria bacterium]|nr:glycosyltransferase family 2 protein [Candidatus Kerfeldbacteria bacterium]
MTRPTVSLVIATYNGAEFIEELLASIRAQTYPIHELIVVDNASTDATLRMLKAVVGIPLFIFPQTTNLDFDKGYNLGIEKTTGEYVCILNQDLVMDPRAIEELVNYLESHRSVGAASPALLRFGSDLGHPIIDSLGISISRSRIFKNIAEGEHRALPEKPQYVFGLTGAALCMRRSALEAVSGVTQEFFDPLFVAYKEDVDISYRFRHAGYDLALVPSSVMFHKRTAQELREISVMKARRQKSFRIRGNSLKNHWWVLIKNEPWSTLCMHALWIVPLELARLCYILLCEPSTLRILPTAAKQLPAMLHKRQKILSHSHISPRQLRSWIQ